MQEPTRRVPGNEEENGLLDYIEIIAARKKLIFISTAAALVVSALLSLALPKVYVSTAKILPPQPEPGLMGLMMGESQAGMGGVAGLAGGLLGIGTPADLYASIMQTDAIKDAVIDRFKLMEVYRKKYRQDMYVKLDKIVEIKAGKKDGIISISVEDSVPSRAADIANAYVEELEKMSVGLSRYGAGQSRAFLDQRLAKAKSDLSAAEDALKVFQERNKAFQVPQQAEATITGIAQLRAQLAMQELQLSTLRRTFTDSSQEVKNALTSIASLKSQLAALEKGNVHGAMPGFGSIPTLGQEYVRLMREVKAQETIVELLTNQREIAKLSEANDVSTIQVIQKARVPDKKTKPKRRKIVLIFALFTFACSTGLVIARYHYDKNISPDTRKRIRGIVRTVSPLLASRIWK